MRITGGAGGLYNFSWVPEALHRAKGVRMWATPVLNFKGWYSVYNPVSIFANQSLGWILKSGNKLSNILELLTSVEHILLFVFEIFM